MTCHFSKSNKNIFQISGIIILFPLMEKIGFLEKLLYISLPITCARRNFNNKLKQQLAIDLELKKLLEHIFKVRNIPFNINLVRYLFLSWVIDRTKNEIDFTKYQEINWTEIVHHNNQCMSIISNHPKDAEELLERFLKVPNKRRIYREFNQDLINEILSLL